MSKYYIVQNDKQEGPYTTDQLQAMNLPKKTLVWYEGMDEWVTSDKIVELNGIFRSEPPPIPNKVSPPPIPNKGGNNNTGFNYFMNGSIRILDNDIVVVQAGKRQIIPLNQISGIDFNHKRNYFGLLGTLIVSSPSLFLGIKGINNASQLYQFEGFSNYYGLSIGFVLLGLLFILFGVLSLRGYYTVMIGHTEGLKIINVQLSKIEQATELVRKIKEIANL